MRTKRVYCDLGRDSSVPFVQGGSRMRLRTLIASLFVLVPLASRADALMDLRTTLSQLAATAPAPGSFEVTSSSTSSDEEKSFQGKVEVGFDIGDAGLRILYPKAVLIQANQEARAE